MSNAPEPMSDTITVPKEDEGRRSGEKTPALTWAMSALCVLFTAAHYTSVNSPPSSFWYQIGHFGHLPAADIWSGQWPALITTLFIHGAPGRPFLTLAHLGFNLMVLLQVGRVLEKTLHPLAYYLFFLLAAMVGSGAELATTSSTGVGASGVVYAMFGLLWAGRKHDKEWAEIATPATVRFVLGWAVLCVVLTQLGILQVANAAHFAGLFFGLAVGWAFVERRHRSVGAVVLGALAALVVMSLTWLPWSPYWTYWKGEQAREARRFDEAIYWLTRSKRLGTPASQIEPNIIAARYMKEHPEFKGVIRYVPMSPSNEPLPFGAPPPSELPPIDYFGTQSRRP